MKHIHLMHQGLAPDRSMMNKGGGGGGGSPYYANMDRLYGAQSRAAEYMLDQSMPLIPKYMENTNQMVDEAMDGTLANKMRQQAGNDSAASMGAALDATNRGMQRYGAQFSTDRMLSEGNKNAIMGAAQKTGAMNTATMGAEDMKWNRNAGGFGQVTGMGTGAMSTMGSAASGYGAAGNAAMQNDAQNAAGIGAFGASIAKNFASGGEVHLANGGDAWSGWKENHPITMGGPGSAGSGPSMAGQLATGIGMGLASKAAGKGLHMLYEKSGLENAVNGAMDKIGAGLSNAKTAIADKINGVEGMDAESTEALRTGNMPGSGATPADVGPTGAEGSTTAPAGETMAGDTSAVGSDTLGGGGDAILEGGSDAALEGTGEAVASDAAADAAATAATEAAVTEGAGAAAAEGLGAAAAANAWNPAGWIMGGLALAGAGGLFDANGGDVTKQANQLGLARRKDMRPGGPVNGPGTETSDSIPAHLSDGEFVLNAEAVRMIGKKKLNQLNDAGLEVRAKKTGRQQAKGGNGKFAGGGMMSALQGNAQASANPLSGGSVGDRLEDAGGLTFAGSVMDDVFAKGGYVKAGLSNACKGRK